MFGLKFRYILYSLDKNIATVLIGKPRGLPTWCFVRENRVRHFNQVVQIMSLNGLSSLGEWTMGRERVCFRCCLALVLICSLALAMQPGAIAQETTAGIQGTVKDAQGRTVPGATVEVTSPAVIGKKEVKTDSTGV